MRSRRKGCESFLRSAPRAFMSSLPSRRIGTDEFGCCLPFGGVEAIPLQSSFKEMRSTLNSHIKPASCGLRIFVGRPLSSASRRPWPIASSATGWSGGCQALAAGPACTLAWREVTCP
jgi:hypothetical protein